MKRFVILLLALILLFSCANKPDEIPQQTAANETIEEQQTTKSDFPEPDIPADANFNGKTFTILYPAWGMYTKFYFAEESNGDIMNDTLYERNLRIEERLNIKITTYCPGDTPQIPKAIKSVVLANEPAYDLALTHSREGLDEMVRERYLVDWNTVPYIDMNKPYWNVSARKVHEMYGLLCYNSSDFIIPDTGVIFYNKSMVTNYHLESPYDIVNDGKWTWVKVKEMAMVVASDLNGDGIHDVEDQYGFSALDSVYCEYNVLVAANVYLVNKAADYSLSINPDLEKFQKLLSMTEALFDDPALTFKWAYNQSLDPNIGNRVPIGVDSNRVLFDYEPLIIAEYYRGTDVDFGILPIPKFDEVQEFYSGINQSGYMVIPQSADDLDLVGMVSELLATENRKTVLPVFYDIALKQKVSRDNDSEKMLDLIFSSIKYDFSRAYNIGVAGIKSDSVSSFIESRIKTWNTQLANFMKYYQEYK